ncbi:MAG: hypothetical protein HKN01_08790 [Acidimicrobiia bacterium]|nr:hypothetical protein [Acidimicrobiia bacterium]NNF69852.1 hypothetical protein [Acidimicrobiia bacterium]
MPEYVYTATDDDGVAISATVEASSPQSALSRVRMQGLEPISISEIGLPDSAAHTEEPSFPRPAPPPPSPRPLPHEIGRFYRWRNPLMFFAVFFSLISTFIFTGFLFAGAGFAALMPALFLALGLGIGLRTWRIADRRLRAWRYGTAAEATITSIGQANYNVNGRSPFKMEYEYAADGVPMTGTRTTFNPDITEYSLGESLWVVFDPARPSVSAEWPPIA